MGEMPSVLLFEDDDNTRQMFKVMIGDLEQIPIRTFEGVDECDIGAGYDGIVISDCNLGNGKTWRDVMAMLPKARLYVMSGDPTDAQDALRNPNVKGSFIKTDISGIVAVCRANH